MSVPERRMTRVAEKSIALSVTSSFTNKRMERVLSHTSAKASDAMLSARPSNENNKQDNSKQDNSKQDNSKQDNNKQDNNKQEEKETSKDMVKKEVDIPAIPIPTMVVPLYKRRQVLLKIGDNFLRVGTGSTPVISQLRPPLRLPVVGEEEDMVEIIRGLGRRRTHPDNFNYQDFVFLADESATLKQSWYHHAKAFFNIRLGVCRPSSKTDTSVVYLAACPYQGNEYEVKYDTDLTGCTWWTLFAVNQHGYMATPLHYPDHCLTKGPLGLRLSPPLTHKDRAGINNGVLDAARTLTILSLPDFAVSQPAVIVD